MTETVPADIAAAIETFDDEARLVGEGVGLLSDYEAARAALDAAILHHLRGHAEMKAALERIEQGA